MICQSWLKGLRRGVFPAPVAVVPFPLRAEAFFVYAVKFSRQKLSYHSLTYNSNVLWNRLQQSSQGFSPRI